MYRTEEDIVLTDLSLACFFIYRVYYIKIKANNTATKYLENNMTQHNVTTCPTFWAPQKILGAQYARNSWRSVIITATLVKRLL